jgi:outer membrane lipoprotein-sorting protein
MKFLRTASTGRLLATIIGVVVAIAAGTAIAVADTGSGPAPPDAPLAQALHQGLAGAPAVTGIMAHITFTNNLIDSSDFTGGNADPLLQGAPQGRLWVGDHQLRLELQSGNGDTQIVVNGSSFWISDPAQNTVYEGTLPADTSGSGQSGTTGSADQGVPSIAAIQSELTHLMQHVGLTDATGTNIASRSAYQVTITPKHAGGLLGKAQVAWDAANGVPLEIGIYARGNSTPVLDLKATDITYGPVTGAFDVTPLKGAKVVKVSTAGLTGKADQAGAAAKNAKHAHVSGVANVAGQVPFTLAAPDSLVGLPRHDTTLLSEGGKPGALVTYGQGVGGMLVIEQKADAGSAAKPSSSAAPGGLSLPTVLINSSTTGQQLATALGTVLRFTSGGVAYTVIGSVPATAAVAAAQALAP